MQIIYAFISLVLLASADAARAAAITNLSDSAKTIEVETASGYRPVVIEHWETWRLPGKIRVRYEGREAWISDDEEYAIWNNAGLGPQKRTIQHGGSLP